MKKLVRALILMITSSLVLSCINEDQMPVKGKVQFAVAPASETSSGGRIMSHPFPDGAYISASIETSTGTPVYSLERIDLIQLGNGYVTVPLELTEGNYHVTDFFVMSEGGDVLYATPKEGSPLAGLVADPLPINFTIAADGILNLQVQVVDVDQQSPEDFGYVSFGVEVVGSDYAVSLFIGEGDALSFASGKLELYQGNTLVHSQDLQAKVNQVNFKGDPNASYKLVVMKEGYTIKTREYVLHTLVDELDGKPLALLLSQATTISLTVNKPSPLALLITTDVDELIIDWGDGFVEHSMLTSGMFIEARHDYDQAGKYYVNITGDLASVTRFEFTWIDYDITENQRIEAVDITRLSELREYLMSWRTVPDEVDFSHNHKLENISVGFSSLRSLDISNNPILKFLYLSTRIARENPANVIEIVNNLYNHAVANDLNEGTLIYYGLLDPLPTESSEKLRYLKHNKGWEIWPNPD